MATAAMVLPIDEPLPAAALATDDVNRVAKVLGLRYVCDNCGGILRKPHRGGFVYICAKTNKPIRDKATLERIKSLVIPPAWENVWICETENGHLQATGRDAKGRKQYRYHPLWRSVRDQTKYNRMIPLGKALPKIRRGVQADLARPGLPREKVLAAVVRLLETTLIRIGNDEYARLNGSFGLTTMKDGHVEIQGEQIRFNFRGKSGKEHSVGLRDRRLAKIVRACQDVPGQELFQYLDDEGNRSTIDSQAVNDYLRSLAGDEFSAKDFRTWHGAVLALTTLAAMPPFSSETEAKRNIVATVKTVSQRLGNRPAVCRKYYIHPVILESYLAGTLNVCIRKSRSTSETTLLPEERCLLKLLEQAAAPKRKRRLTA